MSIETFRANINVSRETLELFERYEELLKKWNQTINLVSKSTLDDIWSRHFLDSALCFFMNPKFERWVDLGTGGGFPGAVVAILAHADGKAERVTCIEADIRKAAFLKTLSIDIGVPMHVLSRRIEDAKPQAADVVSARALAPLKKLLGYAERHLCASGTAIFLKGENWKIEVEEALEHYQFTVENHDNPNQPGSSILAIGDIKRA